MVRLQRRVTDLISKPPPRGRSYFKGHSGARLESAERVVVVVVGRGSNFMERIPERADAGV